MEGKFTRTEMLIGNEGMEKLSNAKVAIFGLGGVGSFVCEGLARSGVGNFVLIDFDKTDESNINRQLIATVDTIGEYKVDLMKERILKINPDAVSLLLLQVGSNLRMLDSELEKLKVFSKDKPATKEMVKEICISNEDLFAFIDSVVVGAKSKALEQYNKLISTRYPLSILATLHSSLKEKIFIKANGSRYSQDELAKLINMHPYRVKLELQKLKQVPIKNLVNLKENLTQAEYKIKSGQSNLAPEREIEYAILR